MKLEQRTILITGGSSGMGFELAKRLLVRGNTVIVTGTDPAKLERATRDLPGAHTVTSDVGDPAAIAALHDKVVAAFPARDTLINNAGTMRIQRFNQDAGKPEVRPGLANVLKVMSRVAPGLMPGQMARMTAASGGKPASARR